MQNLQIGDKVFFTRLSEYRMVDGTFQIEARITKVEIEGIFEYEKDKKKYMFKIEAAQINWNAEELFETEEEARVYAQDKISKISILVDLQEPKEEVEQEVSEGPVAQ